MKKISEELGALRELKYVHDTECGEDKTVNEKFALIESAFERKEKLETMVRDLFNNHIELVIEDDGTSFYKIKRSKGKEKSFTSKMFADVVKEMLEEIK